jgi:hypothetical protein
MLREVEELGEWQSNNPRVTGDQPTSTNSGVIPLLVVLGLFGIAPKGQVPIGFAANPAILLTPAQIIEQLVEWDLLRWVHFRFSTMKVLGLGIGLCKGTQSFGRA